MQNHHHHHDNNLRQKKNQNMINKQQQNHQQRDQSEASVDATVRLIQSLDVPVNSSSLGLTRRLLSSHYISRRRRHMNINNIDNDVEVRGKIESLHRRLSVCLESSQSQSQNVNLSDQAVLLCSLLANTSRRITSSPSTATAAADSVKKTTIKTAAVVTTREEERKRMVNVNANFAKQLHKSSQEHALIRALLYSLQGTPLSLPSSSSSRYGGDCSNMDMVHKIAETAHLLHKIERSIDADPDSIKSAALRDQLSEFYKLIAVLESRLNSSTCNVGKNKNMLTLTIRQLYIYLRTPHRKLQVLCCLSESAPDITLALPLFARTASPVIAETISSIAAITTVPVWKRVRNWVFYGKVSPGFFVGVVPEADWIDRYYLKRDEVPHCLDKDGIPDLLLSVGKEINFIHTYLNCQFSIPSHLHDIQNETKQKLHELSTHMNKFILKALLYDHKLHANLYTLKQYFLLSRGDFWSIFMSSAGSMLDEPASRLRKYELDALMTSAVAPSTHEMFDRVYVRLLSDNFVTDSKIIGWDAFSLNYAVDPPLSVVISKMHIEQYQILFAFIFRVNQIDYKLAKNWQFQTNLEHLLQKMSLHENNLRKISLIRQKMLHFIQNLQSYLQFEVLDAAWKKLVQDLSEAASLSDLIIAHESYLANLLPKGIEKFNSVFVYISRFCEHCQVEFNMLQKNLFAIEAFRRASEDRIARGQWGLDMNQEETPLKEIDVRSVERDALEFESDVRIFLSDCELRSLVFRLQFNGYYS